jgi:uncharacterized delta-60 repeat protein
MPGTIVSFPPGNGLASAVAIQADGKIVVGGTVGCCGNQEFALECYNPNGTLDSTFGSGGIVIMAQPPGISNDTLSGMALDAAGNIVAAGGTYRFLVARFTPTGALDTTFNGTGYAVTNIGQITGNGGGGGSAASVAINPSNGKIAVGGTQFQGNSPNEFAVAQYNPDGSLDTTFNDTGVLTYTFPNSFNDANHAVAYDSTGNIVLAGENDMSSPSLAKYAIVLIDPPSGAVSSTTITDGSNSDSSADVGRSFSDVFNGGFLSHGVSSAGQWSDGVSLAAAGSSLAKSQGGIWSVTNPAFVTLHHPLVSSGAAGLWADQVLDAAFTDFGNDLVDLRL